MSDQIETQSIVSDICDALGRRAIAARLGRSVAAVSNAASDGVFPSAWYIVIREMCAAAGVDCPVAAFNFIASGDQFPALATAPNKDVA